MATFYVARSEIITPLPWLTFALPFSKAAGNYGHLTIFNFTLLGMTPYPADIVISNNPNDYFRAYLDGLDRLIDNRFFVVYAISTYAVLLSFGNSLYKHPAVAVCVISLAFVAVHFLAFPAAFQRNYIFANVLLTVFVFRLVNSLFSSSFEDSWNEH